VSLAIALASGSALAQTPDAGDDIAAAQADFESQLASLDTTDCSLACRALESMRRAAEHLCSLDPGARCADARAKVGRAAERVRASCPSCDAATGTTTVQEKTRAPEPAPPPEEYRESDTTASRNAPSHGGCAGCTAASGACAGGALAAIAIAMTMLARRRRRHGSRRL
jgi:hypothetical protein